MVIKSSVKRCQNGFPATDSLSPIKNKFAKLRALRNLASTPPTHH